MRARFAGQRQLALVVGTGAGSFVAARSWHATKVAAQPVDFLRTSIMTALVGAERADLGGRRRSRYMSSRLPPRVFSRGLKGIMLILSSFRPRSPRGGCHRLVAASVPRRAVRQVTRAEVVAAAGDAPAPRVRAGLAPAGSGGTVFTRSRIEGRHGVGATSFSGVPLLASLSSQDRRLGVDLRTVEDPCSRFAKVLGTPLGERSPGHYTGTTRSASFHSPPRRLCSLRFDGDT